MNRLKPTQVYLQKEIDKLMASGAQYCFFNKYNKVLRHKDNLLKLATEDERKDVMHIFLHPEQDNLVIGKVFFHIDEYRKLLAIAQREK